MPKPKPTAQAPMSVQPSGHDSTASTLSLPRKTTTSRQEKRQPDKATVGAARVREAVRLDALRKQRKAMKR
jgi:hypothetical protein